MTEVFEKIKDKALDDWYKLNSSKWIRIGGGTSGQAMGSYEIFNKAKSFLDKKFTDVDMVMDSADAGKCAWKEVDYYKVTVPTLSAGTHSLTLDLVCSDIA